ncbi:MAG: Rab family GTPase [Promethearchaeota archaeon]
MVRSLIKGIIYSKFDEKIGPTSVSWRPNDVSSEIRDVISLKSISILIGENTTIPDSLAIIPFPSLNLKSLIKIGKFNDENRRGGSVDFSLAVIFEEADDLIFYKYINNFTDVFNDSANRIIQLEEKNANKAEIEMEIDFFYNEIVSILEELREHEIQDEEIDFPKIDLEKSEKSKFRYKIVVCGDPGVGKTSVVLRFTDRAFKRTYIPTMGVNISEKKIIHNGDEVEFIIWDIAGQIKFKAMRKHFYEGSDAQVLVFDLTHYKSFENIKKWHHDIKSFLLKEIPGIIFGNKNDLKNERKIFEEEIIDISKELGFNYITTSALTGDNIDESFHKLADILINFYTK